MHYVDIFYKSDDQLRLYARDYRHADPDAPVLLCLPGLTRNSKDFAGLAEHLGGDYRLVCPDQRGRGRSERDPQPERYRPDRYVADMWRLLDTLGVARVGIIGTSLGGLMAMLMAAQEPQRVDALVLNDVGPEIDPRGIARIAGYVGKLAPVRTWDEALQRSIDINGQAFPDHQATDWRAMAASSYVEEDGVPVHDYDPAIAQGLASTAAPVLWPLFEALGGTPLLVIRGEHSDILSEETVAAMRERLPQVATAQITRVGHAPTLNEAQSRRAIDAFLGARR